MTSVYRAIELKSAAVWRTRIVEGRVVRAERQERNETMTIAEVKRDLPMVKASYHGKLYWARVSGRINRFATVVPFQVISSVKRVKTILGPLNWFSWEAVARAANGESILDCGE